MEKAQAVAALQAAVQKLTASIVTISSIQGVDVSDSLALQFGDGSTLEIQSDGGIVFQPGSGSRFLQDYGVLRTIYTPPAPPTGSRACPNCNGTGKVK